MGDDSTYTPPEGPPTEDEVDDFLFHNLLLAEETVQQLTDPGPLGFSAKIFRTTNEWLTQFREEVESWAYNNSWLGADESMRAYLYSGYVSDDSEIWKPSNLGAPGWIANAPSYVLLAADLLKSGQLLSELPWRDFENLIGHLLESEGWNVKVTQATRDGGVDVIATKDDPVLGTLRSIWQAKKYKSSNKVKLSEVRELSAIRDEVRATKAFMVTTSSLTRDAVAWVKRDLYRLGYKEHEQIKAWLEDAILK